MLMKWRSAAWMRSVACSLGIFSAVIAPLTGGMNGADAGFHHWRRANCSGCSGPAPFFDPYGPACSVPAYFGGTWAGYNGPGAYGCSGYGPAGCSGGYYGPTMTGYPAASCSGCSGSIYTTPVYSGAVCSGPMVGAAPPIWAVMDPWAANCFCNGSLNTAKPATVDGPQPTPVVPPTPGTPTPAPLPSAPVPLPGPATPAVPGTTVPTPIPPAADLGVTYTRPALPGVTPVGWFPDYYAPVGLSNSFVPPVPAAEIVW